MSEEHHPKGGTMYRAPDDLPPPYEEVVPQRNNRLQEELAKVEASLPKHQAKLSPPAYCDEESPHKSEETKEKRRKKKSSSKKAEKSDDTSEEVATKKVTEKKPIYPPPPADDSLYEEDQL